MADKAEKNASDADGAEAPKGGKSAIMVMLIGLLAGAASGIFFVGPMIAGQPAAGGAEDGSSGGGHGEPSGSVHTHLVQGLIVNPAGTGGTRILLISVAIVMDTEDAVAEVEERDPEVRDVLLGVLATKTVEELTDIGRREVLKQELLAAMNTLSIHGEVLQIHIPQFVVQ